jgi:tetratricopeptide (TPR) repeat protein
MLQEKKMRHLIIPKVRVTAAVIIIGFLLFPFYSQADEKEKELEWAGKLFSKGREFFKKGNYNAAVEMLTDFLEEIENKEIASKVIHQHAETYYILSRIYFDAGEFENMEKSLNQLFTIDLNYKIPPADDVEFKEKAELLRKEVEKSRTITVNFSIENVEGPIYVAFFELNKESMTKISDPQKIKLELPKPGIYSFYFLKEDQYIRFDRKISKNTGKTIDFKDGGKISGIEHLKKDIEKKVRKKEKIFRFIEKEQSLPAHQETSFPVKVKGEFDDSEALEMILVMEPYTKEKVDIVLKKGRDLIRFDPQKNVKIEKDKFILSLLPEDLPDKKTGTWKLVIWNKSASEKISLKKAELHFYKR